MPNYAIPGGKNDNLKLKQFYIIHKGKQKKNKKKSILFACFLHANLGEKCKYHNILQLVCKVLQNVRLMVRRLAIEYICIIQR